MRVILCPNCDEPLPGFAYYCAICGETLASSPTDAATKLFRRPRAFNVPRFYAVRSDTDETVPFGEFSPFSSETVKLAQKPPRYNRDSTIPRLQIANDLLEDAEIDDSRPSGNWQIVVDSRPRTPSMPRTLVTEPRRPLPVPLEYGLDSLTTPRPPRTSPRRQAPSLLFWASILALFAVLAGGILGIVLTLGRGALAQKSSHANEITLQVMPASVTLGNVVDLRGSNFSPRGRIGLTRDSNISIVDTDSNTIIQADDKGSFTDTVIVEADWQAGAHLIRAEDAIKHKTAAFTIVVTGHSASLRPPRLLLSSSAIDLGSGDQATNSTKTITLNNSGGGQITWQGTSTQSWLMLSPKSGAFSSGQNIQVTVAADRSNLSPGAYAAEIIFTSSAGQVILPVKMSTTLLQPGHEAVLQLTPAVLSFTGIDGGSNPPAQVLTVSNPGMLSLQWSAYSSANWLSITPQSGDVSKGSSQSAQLWVNSSTLLPGVYGAFVTFTSGGTTPVKGSPQSVYVSLTIVPQCALQVSPGALSFAAVYLQPGPGAKTISLKITQGCSAPLLWNASVTTNTGGHWLNMGSAGGTTPSSPAVSINVSGLKPGVYNASIIFSCPAGTQMLPVTFTMGQPTTPLMSTTPASMAFSAIIGQPDPTGQAITLTNSGGGILNWQASAATSFGGAWLSVTPATGNLTSHQSATVNVTVTLLNGLTPNTYPGIVTMSGTDGSGHPAAGSPQSIPVDFTVQNPCAITGIPSALSFAGVFGQPAPQTQPVTMSASGACTHSLNWSASAGNITWLTTSPSSGTVSVNSTATTNIGVALSGLSANTYTGQVTITATDSITHQTVGTPQTIIVTLTVQPACTLQPASLSQENLSAEVGTTVSQSFTIGIIGGCTGNITITPTLAVTQSWLTVTPTSAVIKGGSTTFTVAVTSASLAVGQYNDAVSLSAVDGNGITITGSPQTVGVALAVIAAPSLTVSPSPSGLTINVISGMTSQPISINNTGGEPLDWTAALGKDAPAFAKLSASTGTGVLGGASASDSVIVDATGVPGGTSYTTSVTVNATDPITHNPVAGGPVTIPITINIASPTMQLDTSTLTYASSVGVNPQPQSVNLTNIGGDGLTWTAGSPSQSWLTLSMTKGSDNYQQTSTIPFNVDVTGLTSGTYPAMVTITPSVGGPQIITVTLTIT